MISAVSKDFLGRRTSRRVRRPSAGPPLSTTPCRSTPDWHGTESVNGGLPRICLHTTSCRYDHRAKPPPPPTHHYRPLQPLTSPPDPPPCRPAPLRHPCRRAARGSCGRSQRTPPASAPPGAVGGGWNPSGTRRRGGCPELGV